MHDMLTEAAIGIALAVLMTLALLGGVLLCGIYSMRILRLPHSTANHLLLGFIALPVCTAYLGFAGMWKIPYSLTVAGIALAMYGMQFLHKNRTSILFAAMRARGSCLLIPSILFVYLLIAKISYLWGIVTYADEGWRVLFIGGFANNFLKPAHPLFFSQPLSYPYYLFETGAFLYGFVQGISYPTIPLFVVSMTAILLSFVALYEICTLCSSTPKKAFLYISLLLSASGLTLYSPVVQIPFLEQFHLQQMTNMLGSGYHYFFGSILVVLSFVYLDRWFRHRQRTDIILSEIYMLTCFGFAGIPFAWAMTGAVLYVLIVILHKKSLRLLPDIQTIGTMFIVGIFLMLPQWPNILPRSPKMFSWIGPHLWFIRPGVDIVNKTTIPDAWWQILAGPLTLLTCFGILLTVAFIALPWISIHKKIRSHTAITALTSGIWGGWILLTCTNTIAADWYGRGMLCIGIFTAVCTGLLLTISPHILRKLVIVLACVQLIYFYGVPVPQIHNVPEATQIINRTYDLGTVFAQENYNNFSEAVVNAGRGVFTSPPISAQAYFLSHPMMSILNLNEHNSPCDSTWFGANIPQKKGFILQGNTVHSFACDSN